MEFLSIVQLLIAFVLVGRGLTLNQSFSLPDGIKFSYAVHPLSPGGPYPMRRYPWPRLTGQCSAYQPVRYCFKDHRSADNLAPIVASAIEKWMPAMQDSALRIMLDPESAGDPHKLCNELVQDIDALMISDETRDGDDNWNLNECDTATSTGYQYTDDDDSDALGRHKLEFCHLTPGDSSTRAPAVIAMTHELGHAIGLQHEHQRPDRDDHLEFQCQNLVGYERARSAADLDEKAMFDDDDDDTDGKMSRVCTEYLFAEAYFPAAITWIKGDMMDGEILHEGVTETWKSYHAFGPFDYDSIMTYNSDDNTHSSDSYAIVRRDNGAPIWQGGSQSTEEKMVSAGDVANVERLYPLAAQGAASRRPTARPTTLRMFFRDEL